MRTGVSREHAYGFTEKQAVNSLKARILLSRKRNCFSVYQGNLYIYVNSTKYPVLVRTMPSKEKKEFLIYEAYVEY